MPEENSTLSWDDPSIDVSENVTEQEAKAAEFSGRPPVGRYLCVCVDSRPRQNDMTNYSCIAANLKWEIERVLEIEGKQAEGDQGEEWVGKFIYDDVNLHSPLEKEGMRSRRILIAKRIGLIPPTGGQLTTKMWGKDVIGKRAIINFIEDSYTDKAGVAKKIRKVAFDGYDYADNATAVTQDDFADI